MEKEDMEKMLYWGAGIIVLILVIAIFFSIPKPYDETKLINNTVVRVIDGDTFEYYNADLNKVLKVRLLCVNTPEKGKDGYTEATAYLRSLILYKEVNLTSSVTDKDKYGRLLRYVYMDDFEGPQFVNQLIIDGGYGKLLVIPPETCKEMKK